MKNEGSFKDLILKFCYLPEVWKNLNVLEVEKQNFYSHTQVFKFLFLWADLREAKGELCTRVSATLIYATFY